MLVSDRELVYWVSMLETNPLVLSFEFQSHAPETKKASLTLSRTTLVHMNNGISEVHLISFGGDDAKEKLGNRIADDRALNDGADVAVRIFSDAELRPLVNTSKSWLKVIAYVSAIREFELSALRTALILVISKLETGMVADLIEELPEFDAPSICGMIGRFAIEGVLTLDLASQGFCKLSPWSRAGE